MVSYPKVTFHLVGDGGGISLFSKLGLKL